MLELDLGLGKPKQYETYKNVDEFFKGKFDRMQNMAHVSFVDLKSPVISGMPGGNDAYGNSMDEKFSKHVNARIGVNNVLQAARSLRRPYREIIEGRYLRNMTWHQVSERACISERQAQRQLQEACVAFAMAYCDVENFCVYE